MYNIFFLKISIYMYIACVIYLKKEKFLFAKKLVTLINILQLQINEVTKKLYCIAFYALLNYVHREIIYIY